MFPCQIRWPKYCNKRFHPSSSTVQCPVLHVFSACAHPLPKPILTFTVYRVPKGPPQRIRARYRRKARHNLKGGDFGRPKYIYIKGRSSQQTSAQAFPIMTAVCEDTMANSSKSILPFIPRSIRYALLVVLLANVRSWPFVWHCESIPLHLLRRNS